MFGLLPALHIAAFSFNPQSRKLRLLTSPSMPFDWPRPALRNVGGLAFQSLQRLLDCALVFSPLCPSLAHLPVDFVNCPLDSPTCIALDPPVAPSYRPTLSRVTGPPQGSPPSLFVLFFPYMTVRPYFSLRVVAFFPFSLFFFPAPGSPHPPFTAIVLMPFFLTSPIVRYVLV